jgi:phosphofructokinase-like protein
MAKNSVKRVGVLTGGGDCPGLNAVIRGVSKALIEQGVEVFGVEDGFLGLIEKRIRRLSWDDVSGILAIGGTILGTSNSANPFQYPEESNGKTVMNDVSDHTVAYINEMRLDALVCIGGDGTMTIAHQLTQKGVHVVGVPKTIDNDLYGTDITFGYDSAVATATEAIDKIHTTAQSHHRVMIIEVMGRYAGWLALGAGIAGGGDVILIPELPYQIDAIYEAVLNRSHKGKRFSIIVVAEGAKPKGGGVVVKRVVKESTNQIRLGGIGHKVGREIEAISGLETRVAVLGHLQRGGSPTAFDRILATRFGVAAADLIISSNFNKMVALRGEHITAVSLDKVGGRCRKVPLDSPLIDVARKVDMSMGVFEM